MITQFIYPGDKKNEARYNKFLEETNSYFQQTLAWRDVILSFKTDQSVVIIVEDQHQIIGAIPLFIFSGKYGNIITSVPYPGPLGGVIIKSNQPETVFKTLMEQVDKLAVQENCCLATIISSPFWPDDGLYRKYFKPSYELENYTLSIDLMHPKPYTSHFRNNLKRMLEKAREKCLIIKESKGQADLDQWYLVYKKRLKFLRLDPTPKKLFDSFLKYLIPQNGKFLVVKDKDKIIAGCLIGYHKTVLDTYLYFGTNESYKNGAIYLLMDYLINWAKKEGFKYFNWQSSKPRGGGPYNFKMQWGSKELPYFFFTKAYSSIDHFKKLKFEEVQNEYKHHFVLPNF